MDSKTIKELCNSLPGGVFDYKPEWDVEWAVVGGKMFAAYSYDNLDNRILSLKAEPDNVIDLCLTYPDVIVPGYHFNKRHWISIRLDKGVDNALVEQLIKDSYYLVFAKLTKRVQLELAE